MSAKMLSRFLDHEVIVETGASAGTAGLLVSVEQSIHKGFGNLLVQVGGELLLIKSWSVIKSG